MAYKSKNLKTSKNKAFVKKSDTQSELMQAISQVNSTQREQKKLDEMKKLNKQFRKDTRFFSFAAKSQQDNMDLAKEDYSDFKKSYNKLISSDKYKDSTDNFFPDFDSFYKKRTKARVGGVELSASDISSNEMDIDKLNLIMSMMGLEQGE
jgi:hypothetical protein